MPDLTARWTETDVPARLDRLPWSRWHWLVVVALGITWVLDGLEVTLAGSVAGVLKDKASLGLTDTEVGLTAAAYLSGAVLGALLFGYLTDRLGRKKLFTVTLLLYLAATAATAFSWNLESYLVFRFFTGAGIGGEYSAINLGHRRVDPGPGQGPRRSHHQLHLLARRGARGRGLDPAPRSRAVRGRPWMALRLRDRRRARLGDPVPPPLGSGKPALAHDARAERRS